MTSRGSRTFPWVQVDVFAQGPLQGNPLAVFTDARGLSDREMQAVAREMNLSETAFVLPVNDGPARGPHRVRIFTVAEEIPFAGHPTLGTAAVIRGASRSRRVELALPVGVVPVDFEDDGGGTFGEMTQPEPVFGATHDRAEVADALGLRAGDLSSDLPVQTVSTGLPSAIVPLESLAVLRELRLDWGRAAGYLARTEAKSFYLVSRETVDAEARLHARMIFYGGEDPATGSAAGCCAAWMVSTGLARAGERVLIEQGLEVNRPSRLHVRADREGDRVFGVRVGGRVVEVARGELFL